MKLIFESWRAHINNLEEECQGSACLDEYLVEDFLNDVGKYTGLVQRFSQAVEKLTKAHPDDNAVQNIGKKMINYARGKGTAYIIGAGVGGLLGTVVGPGGTLAGTSAGVALSSIVSDVVKTGLAAMSSTFEKMFISAQGEDPPTDSRGWILDLNDKVESLMKGGAEKSPIYDSFIKKLVEIFEEAEERINTEIVAAGENEDAKIAILSTPMRQYLDKTASQEAQDFIKTMQGTADVAVAHPEITEE